MVDEINITIDGVQVRTRPGKMVLEAAIDAGLYVPYLCYHPGMKPFAACRMCVVEVEGGRGFPASCTLPVQEGMVVKSDSHQVYELRRSIMEMLISEHPHGCLTCHRVDLCGPQDVCLRHVSVNDRCVTCPKNERCELKDTTRALNMSLESPLGYKYRDLPIETGDPFYDRDYNLCIVCGRCVRVCEEVRGDNAITFTDRAGTALVGTSRGTSLLESGCEFCGACLDVCPVGALVESDYKWEKASRVEKTVCPHCPVGCQLNLEVNRFDKVVRVVPELNSPANKGQACFKGKFGLDFVNRRDRLRAPLIRRDGSGGGLEEATWDAALDYIARSLPSYKGDQFAILTSPSSTNEEHYLAQKFARSVMVTNNVDQTSDTRPALALGLAETLGYAAATNPIWDLEGAGCILVFNANVTEEHNVAAVPVKKAVKAGARLIVIDPREVELTRYAHIWLKPRPGTELLVLGALLKAMVDEGLHDQEWMDEHCQDPGELMAALETLDMESASAEAGVPVDAVREAARMYAGAETGALMYALDNVPRELHRDCVLALADMALLTGNLGRPSTGIYPLRQGTNEQGAWDMGCVPHLLPGYRILGDPQAQQAMEARWGNLVPFETGLDLWGILDAASKGDIKAMLVVGGGEDFSTEGFSSWAHGDEPGVDPLAALGNLDLLVVMDHFLSPLAQRADVVLPRATFAEKEGTFTNLERRVQSLRPAIALKNSQARPEWWALCQVAQKMGASGFDFSGPAEVMEEVAELAPIYAGVSQRRLQAEAILVARPDTSNPLPIQLLYSESEARGLQWPCTGQEHPGTALLYAEGFPEGKARPMAPSFRAAQPVAREEYPLLLVPGRVLLESETTLEVVATGSVNHIERNEVVELSPDDARSLGIQEGDEVEVRTPARRFSARAAVVEGAPVGVVRTTGLFGQLAVELQASEEPDPMSKVPGLVIAPAAVERVLAG